MKLTTGDRIELQQAIAESDIAACSLDDADIDALVDLFEAWAEHSQDWNLKDTAPADGSTFRAYGANLIHADFNPWGSVEAVFDGEKFIGAVWDGQFDCWNTVPIEFTHWQPISDSPSYEREVKGGR